MASFFLVVIVLVVVLIGLVILTFNFSIASIFITKPAAKKEPVDLIKIAGLFGHGIYGLLFTCIPSMVLAESLRNSGYFSMSDYFLDAIFTSWLLMDSSMTLFNLMMIFIMTLNRYFAIMRPMRSKFLFTWPKVLLLICSAVTVSCTFFITGLTFVLSPSKVSYYEHDKNCSKESKHNNTCVAHLVTNSKLSRKVHLIYHYFWPEIQLVFVFFVCVLLSFVYNGIANEYRRKIQLPRDRGGSIVSSPSTRRNTISNGHKGTHSTTSEERIIESSTQNESNRSGHHTMKSSPTRRPSDTNAIASDSSTVKRTKKANYLKHLKKEEQTTRTFFLIAFIFLSAALPITIAAAFFSWLRKYDFELDIFGLPDDRALLIRLPYCLVAFIDPIIYSTSNSMVKNRLKILFERFCCHCRKTDIIIGETLTNETNNL